MLSRNICVTCVKRIEAEKVYYDDSIVKVPWWCPVGHKIVKNGDSVPKECPYYLEHLMESQNAK